MKISQVCHICRHYDWTRGLPPPMDGTAENFIQRIRKIDGTSKSLVERLVDFRIFALAVLGCLRSISAPDAATLKQKAHALQCINAWSYNAFSTDFLRAGSVFGRGIDLFGIRVLSVAAWFRVAANSNILADGLSRAFGNLSTIALNGPRPLLCRSVEKIHSSSWRISDAPCLRVCRSVRELSGLTRPHPSVHEMVCLFWSHPCVFLIYLFVFLLVNDHYSSR